MIVIGCKTGCKSRHPYLDDMMSSVYHNSHPMICQYDVKSTAVGLIITEYVMMAVVGQKLLMQIGLRLYQLVWPSRIILLHFHALKQNSDCVIYHQVLAMTRLAHNMSNMTDVNKNVK